MKRVLSIACLIFSFTLAVSLSAQAHRANRRHEDRQRRRLCSPHERNRPEERRAQQVHQGRHAAEAATAAARLEVLLKNVHTYWSEKKVEDATTAAQTVVTSLQAVQKALTANDMAAAETARAAIGANCMACHTAHREKLPEGGFKSSSRQSQIDRSEDYKGQSAHS